MPVVFERDDLVQHAPQGPSGRIESSPLHRYTIVKRMPVESDGRIRYRIKSLDSKTERVVTEEQLSRAG